MAWEQDQKVTNVILGQPGLSVKTFAEARTIPISILSVANNVLIKGEGTFYYEPLDVTSIDDNGITCLVTFDGGRLLRDISLVDPGHPRILYSGPTTIRALSVNRRILLNGFRVGGYYSKKTGPSCYIDHDSMYSYNYTTLVDGFGAPGLSVGSPDMWVAVYAVLRPGENVATIRFVPYIKVTAWNALTRIVTFDSVAGVMSTLGEWNGVDVLACHESGLISWRQSKVTSNTANTITLDLSAANWSLAAGDYLLLAPSMLANYKYICSLKLDYSPLLVPTYEWRNFAFGSGVQYGYTGNPFGNISSTVFIELDFRGYVSPISTGVNLSIQTYRLAADNGASYVYFSHDSSNHVIAQLGVDRTSAYGDGFSAPLPAGFGAKQSLWTKVGPDGNVVGRATILGGME